MSIYTLLAILGGAAIFGLICGTLYHFIPSTGWLAYGSNMSPFRFGVWMAFVPSAVCLTVYFAVSAMNSG
jgi:hypothetical protein